MLVFGALAGVSSESTGLVLLCVFTTDVSMLRWLFVSPCATGLLAELTRLAHLLGTTAEGKRGCGGL